MGTKTNDPDAILWKTGIFENGKAYPVTNMTKLICAWTTNNDQTSCKATLTSVNGKFRGSLTTVTFNLKNVPPPD